MMLLAICIGAALGEETPQQKLIVSVERIWDRAEHSAFTDLARYEDFIYCVFREGSGHIPGRNGVIRVIRSRDAMNWTSVALLDEPHVDLRDPKLSVTADGRLMITMGASYYHGSQRLRIESRVAFCQGAEGAFSAPQKVELPDAIASDLDWLWRVTWHEGWGWGCVQQVPNNADRGLQLVRSRDGVHYEQVALLQVSHPTETTLCFTPEGDMLAMARRTGSQPVGWVGRAKAPFTQWEWKEADRQFGGPNLIQLPSGAWLAGSRAYHAKGATTELWRFDPQSHEFRDLIALPSAGDNSYPGFLIDAQRNRCRDR